VRRWLCVLVVAVLFGGAMAEHPANASVRLAAALAKLRDAETGRHMLHVARYTAIAASAMPELTSEYIEHLALAASAHDIGKVGIPDRILLKVQPLTAGEMYVVRAHVTSGAKIVERLVRDLELETWEYVSVLRAVVRSHHEHFDGSGYPDGLRGNAIPLPARIVAVADVWDALVTGRPYHPGWTPEDSLAEVCQHTGSQFDEACVSAFTDRFGEIVEAQRVFAARLPSTRGT
jgi:putative two-component system response regulator